MDTVWVLGDQLNRGIASLRGRSPSDTRILMIEAADKIAAKQWHRQRLHLVLAAMRRFAAELEDAGFEVDYRRAHSFRDGFTKHVADHSPGSVAAMEPMSRRGLAMLRDLDVDIVRSNQFLCHYEDFAAWAKGRSTLVMEDFYRWQRRRLGYLMEGEEPVAGRWNFDTENREPPPTGGGTWPEPQRSRQDETDEAVLADLPDDAFGAAPDGTWATSRRAALARLRHFAAHVLPRYGPHQDAMVAGEWSMAHSLLSPYLNLGLLFPDEVCDAAEEAYRAGRAPIASVEGFIRQVIGWREYVWGLYWLWMPGYAGRNALDADRPLPPSFTFDAGTEMRCLAESLAAVHDHAYAHHIQRLMILGNLSLLAGIDPAELTDWMWRSFIDGAEWVMVPNVVGMATYADGGMMATKPYAAGGNYINRMSTYCESCRYDHRARTGDDACPFTTLYWDFLARNRPALESNHRLRRQLANLDRLSDLGPVRDRAQDVLRRLDDGEL